jgi:hypothetical protein
MRRSKNSDILSKLFNRQVKQTQVETMEELTETFGQNRSGKTGP